MTESLLSLFAPMLLGAQLVLTLVLIKGEICPGQRGRVHKLLPVIGILWLMIMLIDTTALFVAVAIFYFFSRVQTKKTRDKGPLWSLYLADGLAVLFVSMQLVAFSSFSVSIAWICMTVLLGAIFANLLLLIARSRLDAFHKILPVIGIICGILMALLIAIQVLGVDDASMVILQYQVLSGLALLVVGLLIWSMHLVTRHSVNKVQLSITLVMLLCSGVNFYPLLML